MLITLMELQMSSMDQWDGDNESSVNEISAHRNGTASMQNDNQALIRQLPYYHFKADAAKYVDGGNNA